MLHLDQGSVWRPSWAYRIAITLPAEALRHLYFLRHAYRISHFVATCGSEVFTKFPISWTHLFMFPEFSTNLSTYLFPSLQRSVPQAIACASITGSEMGQRVKYGRQRAIWLPGISSSLLWRTFRSISTNSSPAIISVVPCQLLFSNLHEWFKWSGGLPAPKQYRLGFCYVVFFFFSFRLNFCALDVLNFLFIVRLAKG